MPPESTITAGILKMLRAIPNGYALKIHGSEFQRAGVPDILFWKGHPDAASPALIWDGNGEIVGEVELSIPFAFEVKQPGKKATPIQKVQLDRMERAGVQCAIVRSVAEVRAILGSLGIEM